jgi:hypothetical protein
VPASLAAGHAVAWQGTLRASDGAEQIDRRSLI